ncbi:hypothetical protein ANAPC2_00886 [Anaplasma phagocytophilum]|nr:hypothetical protein ANAPC2_00886 [Anaplasma phagocytophilum]
MYFKFRAVRAADTISKFPSLAAWCNIVKPLLDGESTSMPLQRNIFSTSPKLPFSYALTTGVLPETGDGKLIDGRLIDGKLLVLSSNACNLALASL